jgi:hypothetical protein
VTSEAELLPDDYREERGGEADRWPRVSRTRPRFVPDELLELKAHELVRSTGGLQNGHIRLRFDQFTNAVAPLPGFSLTSIGISTADASVRGHGRSCHHRGNRSSRSVSASGVFLPVAEFSVWPARAIQPQRQGCGFQVGTSKGRLGRSMIVGSPTSIPLSPSEFALVLRLWLSEGLERRPGLADDSSYMRGRAEQRELKRLGESDGHAALAEPV